MRETNNDDEGFTKEHTCYLSDQPNPPKGPSFHPRALPFSPQNRNVKQRGKLRRPNRDEQLHEGGNRPNLTMVISEEEKWGE
jgi:hypothetical protein